MKKLLVMAAMVLSSVGAFAQYQGGEITIQPKVGLSAASTTASGADFKAGFIGGVEGEYHFNKLIGLSVGVVYSQEGAKSKDADQKLKADYINVPVLANFYVANGLALKAGIQPGFKASSKLEVKGVSVTDKSVNSVNFSIPIGISYEFSNICLDARYQVGVTDMFDMDGSAKGQAFQLTLGYKFAL